MSNYLHDIHAAFEEIEKDSTIDTHRIGVIASSISALFMGYYIAQSPKKIPSIKSYATISPLPGWNYFVTPRVREMLLASPEGINISSIRDRKRGIIRYIPPEGRKELQEADAVSVLKSYKNETPALVTITGTQDVISNQGAMREYHAALGGRPENLLRYEAEHDIPQEMYQEELVEFFKHHLL